MLLNFKKWKREIFLALVIPFAYALVAFITIGHYGVSPDEPQHFRRGQAYLHYFLTGKITYEGLPKPKQGFIPPWDENIVPGTNPHNIRRSYYQSDSENGKYFFAIKEEQGHPPINDIFAALTNYIFYQKLGILDDIDAHHVFGLISVTILIFVIYIFTRINYGIFAGFVASFSLALYPLFFGEAHFNIKDPPETAFFTLTIFFLWLGIVKKNAKALIASAITCAIALGTKFNIVFLPFIILPWFIIRRNIKLPIRIYIAFLLFPVIVSFVFIIANPNLWTEPFEKISAMINYYLHVGTVKGGSPNYQANYLLFGFNTYPLLAILYSTPLVILFFGAIGFFVSLATVKKEKEKTKLLILLWLMIPILRVSLPGTVISGGIRHIFEFIPALAILAGIGANYIVQLLHYSIAKLKKQLINRAMKQWINSSRQLLQLAIIVSFTPIAFKLISLHPNENVYFNPLIGGLKGAKEKNFPYWGSSLGNTYFQGVQWLNQYAEKKACVSTPIALMGNVPASKLRHDILYTNSCLSFWFREGEYAMDMVYQGYFNDWYAYSYYDKYLYPVFEVKVEGVTIFKVFKNDKEHTKQGFIKEEKIKELNLTQDGPSIKISLPKDVVLSALNLYYDVTETCKVISDGYVITSRNGEIWKREADNITVGHGRKNFIAKEKRIERRFAAVPAKYIKLETNLDPNCKITITKLEVFHHPELNPATL